MRKHAFYKLLAITLILNSCSNVTTDRPTIDAYELGEKWVWDWKRSVDGEIRAQGTDIQEVVNYHGEPGFWNGVDTIKIASTLRKEDSNTPFRSWPLYVGKKWKYESKWSNNEGTTGKTTQDAQIVSYEALHVKAGKFKAYKIEYKGLVTNSRGFKGNMNDTWWYAPELKTYIKHVNEDGYGIYTNELVDYTKSK